MERILDERKFRAIREDGHGVVFNDFAGHGASASQYNVLHAASCRWLIRSNTSVPKIWFEELTAAVDWLTRERGTEGRAWRRCTTCQAAKDDRSAARPPARPRVPKELVARGDARSSFVVASAPDSRAVVAWSKTRLPFEPRAEMLDFRNELRNAITLLSADPGQALHAIYGSPIVERFDVENALLYNVGVGAFGASTHSELVIERSFAASDDAPSPVSGAAHRYEYRIAPPGSPWSHWSSIGDSAAFGPVAVDPVAHIKKVSGVWLAMRRSDIQALDVEDDSGPIGLQLIVDAPAQIQINLAALSKPLIDGVVSAFHSHGDPLSLDLVASRIADQVDSSVVEVRNLLTENPTGILGSRRLVWSWRDGVQWNPADDRIAAARIHRVIRPSANIGSEPILLSGVIQKLRPQGKGRPTDFTRD